MARKKGGPSRMDMRRAHEAAEARESEEIEVEEEETEEEASADDEEADELDEEAEGDLGGDVDDDSGDDDDDEDRPKKKKAKKKVAAPKKAATKRTRTPKEVRLKAVWVVFDNSSKRVETFPYSQKKEAEEFLAKKIEEKKSTFYLNLVKDPYDDK